MPLVLPSDMWDTWLNQSSSEVSGDESVKVATDRMNFSHHRVSRKVNNSLAEGPDLVDST
jgi:putative SOS response-associated peptidase YedK